MRSASSAASSRSCVTSTIGMRRRAPQRQFALEPLPRHPVHRREGFVEQQHLRVARQRPRHRHALLLAAGQLRRHPRFQSGEVNAGEQLARPAARAPRRQVADAPRSRCPAPTGAETARSSGTRSRWSAAAACDRCRRGVEPGRRRIDAPGARAVQAGDAAQHRRLAAARRSDQRQRFARRAGELALPAGSARCCAGAPRGRRRRRPCVPSRDRDAR